jgi:hypothetical protein
MNPLRVASMFAVLGVLLALALSYEEPMVMLIGLALPGWIALEACWHVFDPNR